jgi:hypothetical protein
MSKDDWRWHAYDTIKGSDWLGDQASWGRAPWRQAQIPCALTLTTHATRACCCTVQDAIQYMCREAPQGARARRSDSAQAAVERGGAHDGHARPSACS